MNMISTRLIGLLVLVLASHCPRTFGQQADAATCNVLPKIAPRRVERSNMYKVAVMGIRGGAEQAYASYNSTFNEYLTAMVGKQFDPPISFELVPIVASSDGFLDFLASGNVDFMFMQTGAFSCIESEVGARSLATVVSRRVVNNEVYKLNGYGGVMFTRADNTEVDTVEDIKGKRTSCVSIEAFGAGQVQFRNLMQAGVHYIQDVAQLVFMEQQPRVVNAVLRGEVDVGYVRTDQLERTIDDSTGELVDLSLIKVIDPEQGLLDNGNPFPFPSSTRLYPEWSMSAFPHVSNTVASAVQEELFHMEQHAEIAQLLLDCYSVNGCDIAVDEELCKAMCFSALDPTSFQRCDTTPQVAMAAHDAMLIGNIGGWSPSASYMEVRSMQEDLGFLQLDLDTGVRCMRTAELSDAVTCPPGHFKKTKEEIATGCEIEGLDCYGYVCLCSPCVEAFDVDFFPKDGRAVSQVGYGCGKFELCGEVEQSDTIVFRAIDNRKREQASFTASILLGSEENAFAMAPVPGTPHAYEFNLDANRMPVGEAIVLVSVDGEQIPESPFRLKVHQRDCEVDFSGGLRVADEYGQCVCENNSVDVLGNCVRLSVLLPSIIVPVLLILGLGAYLLGEEKRKANDSIWQVIPSEIQYESPPLVIGRGTFGMVLLGEYRGTKVAVKRVLPPVQNRASKQGHFDFDEEGSEEQSPSHCVLGTSSRSGLKSVMAASERSSNLSMRGSSVWLLSKKERQTMEKHFVSEMRLLSKLRHPCITTTMGAVLSGRNQEPMLIMEYMELGSLSDLLQNDSMILEGEILLPILRDITRGIRFLHAAEPQIVHSDLKAANVLVDSRFHAKVSDFGLSRRNLIGRSKTVGTPYWMAPELLREETTNTAASDIYAFGIVLFEVMSRQDPYDGELAEDVLMMVADPRVNKRPQVPKGASSDAADLMTLCLHPSPEQRPSVEDIAIRLDVLDGDRFDAGNVSVHRPKATHKKHQTAEDLLSQLFPPHIATALREGRKVQPEPHDSATVYFSDIVDYTAISASLPATKVSDLLDRLYTKFDHLCDDYDVFKVETVGDAYMTVTNVAHEQPDHAKIMARFALKCMASAATTLIDADDPSRGYVRIRSGLNSGPVVAHVVGRRNPRYSIIGDTVNTAARMESNSKPGSIQCSFDTHRLLQDESGSSNTKCYTAKYRGSYNIKGKGEMALYWILPPTQPREEQPRTSLLVSGDCPMDPTVERSEPLPGNAMIGASANGNNASLSQVKNDEEERSIELKQ